MLKLCEDLKLIFIALIIMMFMVMVKSRCQSGYDLLKGHI